MDIQDFKKKSTLAYPEFYGMEKEAFLKALVNGAKRFLGSTVTHTLTGGAVLPLAMDYRMNSDPNAIFGYTTLKDLFNGKLGKDRAFNLGVNTALGLASGGTTSLGIKKMKAAKELGEMAAGVTMMGGGIGTAAFAPGKDLLFNSQELPGVVKDTAKKFNEVADAVAESAKSSREASKAAADATLQNAKINKYIALGAGGLGLAALGLGGYALYKYLNKPKEGARIKLNLPGKKGDPTTAATVDLPINMPEFSPALTEGLDRAVRLRTRKNIRANSLKRDPETGKLIPYDEWQEKYGDSNTAASSAFPSAIPPGFQTALNKAASTRAKHERFGDLVASAVPATAGILAGSAIAEKFNVDPKYGRAVGGVVGGLIPTLLGRALATISGARTPEEQAEHDAGTPLLEYLIPGYAAFQDEKRSRSEEEEKRRMQMQIANDQTLLQAAIAALPPGTPCPTLPFQPNNGGVALKKAPAATADDEAYDDFDDAELDKDASSAPPQGGPPPQGGASQQGRQVDPGQNQVASGIKKPGDVTKIHDLVNNMEHKLQVANDTPVLQNRKPQSLADISSTMQGVNEIIHNMRYRNA